MAISFLPIGIKRLVTLMNGSARVLIPETQCPIPADFNAMTNLFDLAYQGAVSNLYSATNFHDLIVVREKQPVQMANGKWCKVYGFADGHSQIQNEPPEGFDAHEQTHTVPLPNQ